MSATSALQAPEPDVNAGIEYWKTQPANYDGVLGGFGTGSLPRLDSQGSRQFLLYLLPELSTVPSAIRPLRATPSSRRTRALDVGAGVGRVTSDVLLHLFSDVVLLEPVDVFVNEAYARGRASEEALNTGAAWKGISDKTKSVTFFQGTLQSFDPSQPFTNSPKHLGRVGYVPVSSDSGAKDGAAPPSLGSNLWSDLNSGFDVIWCQWCLGHLSNPDLIAFLRRSHSALRDPVSGLIVVKENVCSDGEGGEPRESFDEQDSSLTRSDASWKTIFQKAGLKLIQEQVQRGFPEGLYTVKMYALR